MDTNELKAIIRKHFREVSPGQGQYVHGSWFEPHHKDSLDDLLDDITSNAAFSVAESDRKVERLEEEMEDLEGRIDDLKRAHEDEVDALNDDKSSLRDTISELREEIAELKGAAA